MFEDSGLFVKQFSAEDDENDEVFFTLDSQQPLRVGGDVSVSADGRMEYRPCAGCHGLENIFIRLVENRRDKETALSISVKIDIEVYEVNDVPVVFIFSEQGLINISENIVEVTIIQNGKAQETSEGLTFLVGATDADGIDRVTLHLESQYNETLYVSGKLHLMSDNRSHCFNSPTEAIKNYTRASINDPMQDPAIPMPCELLDRVTSKQLSMPGRVMIYTPLPGYRGLDEIKLIAEDDAGGLSEIITIKVYVLAEICVNNGTCRGPIHDPNCTDNNRIHDFSGYQCTCAAGFTGTYCQVDFDECSSSPCPDNYTCIDQVASYTCHCELGWPCSYKQSVSSQELWKIISASVPSGIILIGLLVLLFIKFRRPTKSKSSSRKSLRSNKDNTERNTLSRGSGWIRNDLMGYDSGFQNPFYVERPVPQFPRLWFMNNEMSSAENLQVYDDEQEPDYDIQTLQIELTTSSGSGQSPRNPQHGHPGNKESINSDKRPWGEITV